MSTPDPGNFSAPRLCAGWSGREPPPAATSPTREGLAARFRVSPSPPVQEHVSFPSPLEILPRKSKTHICMSFPNTWVTLRNIIYLSGLRVAHY